MSAKSLFRLAWQTGRITVLLALLLGAVFVPTQTALALTFTINTTADTVDASPGNGVCADASGQCSLRAAITEADAFAGADTIDLPAGTYQLTRANAGGVNEDGNSTGDLDINSSLTITGVAGSGSTFIQAGTNTSDGIDKVFGVNPYCYSGVNVTIQNVTIRYGRNTQPYGAADYSYTGGGLDWCGGTGTESFTLQNVVVSDNTNVTGYGGGVNIDTISGNTGTITIDTVTFQNNRTTGTVNEAHGGALNIFGHQPNVIISNSIFTNNSVASSTSKGGAISLRLSYGGSVQIHNSLIDGNTTNGDGGGIAAGAYNSGTTVTIDQNTRIVNNTAGRYGGGIYMFAGLAVNTTPYLLSHLLISGNTATGDPGGGIYIDGINATVQYSRIMNNTASSGTGLQKVYTSGTVTAERNWWGCSAGPGAAGCDTAVVTGGTLDFEPWLEGRLTATPTTVVNGQASALTLSFLQASDNSVIDASNLGQLIGQTVNWAANPALGSISGQTSVQADGRATATFTATGAGTTLLSARVDNDATGSGTSTQSVLVVNPPTVTINQAAGQLDPVNTGPINFTVVFSEAVTGFDDPADVTLSGAPGTLSGAITEIAPNNGTTFNMAVSGMTGSGTVTASIPAGAAQNGSAIPNAASTSTDNTVTYNPIVSTATTLTSNVNPSLYGQSVTFTAMVDHHAGFPVVGVEVTFKEGETVLDTDITDADGYATFTTADLTVGSHNITAVFAGTAQYQGSTSTPLTQTVLDATVPAVVSFTAASLTNSLAIPITTFTASDNVGVTGYLITTSDTLPAADAPNWSGTAPTAFTVSDDGTWFLYPWAKDAAGNVSAVYGSPALVEVDLSAPATHTVADFDGDGDTDISYFRPSTGRWYVIGEPSVAFGASGDIPVPADYDGDGDMDIAYFRPSTGRWYIPGQPSVAFGASGDIPVPGDYDGGGNADIAYFRPSNGRWYVLGHPSVAFGMSGAIPVPSDYGGTDKTDFVYFLPSNNRWYILGQPSVAFGVSGAIPVPADYNGDGNTELAYFLPSNNRWYILGQPSVAFGVSGAIPVPGDYDGDGDADLAYFLPSNGRWYIQGQPSVAYGVSGDFPLPVRDTNGDGDPYQ